MASAVTMVDNSSVRMLLLGPPGSGKTGALASLANAGFKLRIMDLDGNPDSLLAYTRPECLKNIDILSIEDPVGQMGPVPGVKGVPQAETACWKALDRWAYKDPDGTEVDLGKSSDWGPDTVIVLDGLTGHSSACMRKAMSLMNKTVQNVSQPVWGLAQKAQDMYMERLTSTSNRFHVVVISHTKLIGPKDVEQGDSPMTVDLKARLSDMIPTRYFPTAVGKGLPQTIAGHFPTVVLAENQVRGQSVKRQLVWQPRVDIDLKLPVRSTEGLVNLGPEDGLLKIFEALGAKAPC
jgi:hypothetical protein